MTAKQVKRYISEMKKFTKVSSSDPKLSRNILVKAGICTKKGNLTRPYK